MHGSKPTERASIDVMMTSAIWKQTQACLPSLRAPPGHIASVQSGENLVGDR